MPINSSVQVRLFFECSKKKKKKDEKNTFYRHILDEYKTRKFFTYIIGSVDEISTATCTLLFGKAGSVGKIVT